MAYCLRFINNCKTAEKVRGRVVPRQTAVNIQRKQSAAVLRDGLIASLRDYCANASVHGLRFLVDAGYRLPERVAWAGTCLLAVLGAVVMSLEVARRFGSRTTMTVVESTNYPVYEVAYPAVVVCDNNRVHWDKLLDYERRQLPGLDAGTRAVFRSLVTSLAQMEWADFDLFTPRDLANYRALHTLSRVNFSDVMRQVMPKCEEFFHNACYWRSETRNCCDIFEVLLTDIGYCFAFNSLFNHMSRTHSRDGELLPRRVSSSGKWSGLRFDVNTSSLQPPGLSVQRGVVVSVNEPTALRMDGLIVGSDQMALVRVSSDVTYTTQTVRSLLPGDRGCLYSNERDTLQQGAYSYANCRLECFRQYAIATCACLPYFFPPAGNHNTCTAVQFKCLYDNNEKRHIIY
ncbi:pickpocket protein 19-like [Schistocerca gregaria]|uniref:pickpocket protein 19-like n=1 Tax=Schistocerca gregaria TaxID=7010 RepID=UPI00211EBBA3|nr:pickpocket protein 19-like [Schistocerca gregaria]